jgi:hypothetical protein
MKSIVKRAIREEEGGMMVMVLVLLVVGGLVLAPLLGLMSTGLMAGQVYEKKAVELYAADAGVEDAIWRIRNGNVEFNGDGHHTYADPLVVNGKEVLVEIQRYAVEGSTGCDRDYTYQIISTASDTNGGSTRVEAYIELLFFNLFEGALVSSGDITFHKDCTVTGDVYYVGVIQGEDYEHLDGGETQVEADLFPTQQENIAFADKFKSEAQAGGNWTGNLNIDSDRSLGPLYINGNLDITQQNITVSLNGTIYVEGEIRASKDYTITGVGSIVAVGDIYLSKLADYGTEGDTIIMSLNGGITFKKEADIEALVYAPNGSIVFDKDATVVGSVIGANIEIKKDNDFEYLAKASSFDFAVWVPNGIAMKTYTIS